MNQPKVSVVIPAYNEEKYIAKTIECLLNQDYKPYEIIVVDNNSVDKTAEIVKSFPNVIYLKEEIAGSSITREKGRKIAKGELIACVDADCLPDKDWLAKAVKHFTDPDLVALSGPYFYYDMVFFQKWLSAVVQNTFYKTFHFLVYNIFKKGAVIILGNTVIRSAALEKIGGYNVAIKFYGDDTDLAIRLVKVGKMKFINSFSMATSGRRFDKFGFLPVACTYILNFAWVIIFKKPYNNN